MTEVVLLDGYRPRGGQWPAYSLNPDTGGVETALYTSQKDSAKAGPKYGVGDFRKVGSWFARKDGFFAIYHQGDSLLLWLDGRQLDLSQGNVGLHRDSDFLLRKRFRVLVDGVTVFEHRYSYLDYEDFPDEDIFWYAARNLASREGRLRTLMIWQDKVRGVSEVSDEYFRRLDERVRVAARRIAGI